jgi:predicted PurR-regulated permease PerM
MASISSPTPNSVAPSGARAVFQIVGIACLAGFVIDMLVLALPPNVGNPTWRVGLLQQMADRSIVLLLGTAFTIFSLESRRWLRRISMLSLIVGVLFVLASLLVIRDSMTLQQQAVSNISTQASQAQTQIQNAQTNPPPNLKATPEQLQQLSKQINTQADSLKQTAKTTVLKTSVSSIGNLIVIGLGLIGLGRYGMRVRKNKAAVG